VAIWKLSGRRGAGGVGRATWGSGFGNRFFGIFPAKVIPIDLVVLMNRSASPRTPRKDKKEIGKFNSRWGDCQWGDRHFF
jgi:hypothetical protein